MLIICNGRLFRICNHVMDNLYVKTVTTLETTEPTSIEISRLECIVFHITN